MAILASSSRCCRCRLRKVRPTLRTKALYASVRTAQQFIRTRMAGMPKQDCGVHKAPRTMACVLLREGCLPTHRVEESEAELGVDRLYRHVPCSKVTYLETGSRDRRPSNMARSAQSPAAMSETLHCPPGIGEASHP